jgi:transposase InsO family protein
LPGLAAHYARRTERLDGWFTHVSFALGEEAGARLLKDLGIVVSGDTLLNHIRLTRLQDHETPRVLSVDDIDVERSITAEVVIETLATLFRRRGEPIFIRSDNGPEFVAKAIKRWLEASGVKTLYIEPGSPWENTYLRKRS